ncbi:MAG TPA: TIGR01244 family sulfur transferase [Noviherbaspirillum sp.]
MQLSITQIGEGFSVSPQLSPGDLEEAARLGFRSVINNRPDGEGGTSQPLDAELRAAAEAAGLFYAHLPVASVSFDDSAAVRMRALVGELPKPILAFCRTGTRSTKLYQAALAKGRTANAVSTPAQGKAMKANIGGIDRLARIAVGAGLIGAAAVGAIGAWGWLGVVPLATGVFRFCPAYLPFGLSSCRVKG